MGGKSSGSQSSPCSTSLSRLPAHPIALIPQGEPDQHIQSREAFPSQGNTGDLTESDPLCVKSPQNAIPSLSAVAVARPLCGLQSWCPSPQSGESGKWHIAALQNGSCERLTHRVLGNAEIFTFSEMPAWSRESAWAGCGTGHPAPGFVGFQPVLSLCQDFIWFAKGPARLSDLVQPADETWFIPSQRNALLSSSKIQL